MIVIQSAKNASFEFLGSGKATVPLEVESFMLDMNSKMYKGYIKYAVMREMFCHCGNCLDVNKAAFIETAKDGKDYNCSVVCKDCFGRLPAYFDAWYANGHDALITCGFGHKRMAKAAAKACGAAINIA